MESSKHNDELIKRKLADVSVEPRNLKFASVHTNYQKAAKASSFSKWGMYSIFAGIGIAVILSAYLLLNNGSENTLAQNKAENASLSELAAVPKQTENTSTSKENTKTEIVDNTSNTISSTNNAYELKSVSSTSESDKLIARDNTNNVGNERSSNVIAEKQEPKSPKKENTIAVKKEKTNSVTETRTVSSVTKETNTPIVKGKPGSTNAGVPDNERSLKFDQPKKKETKNANSSSETKPSKEKTIEKEKPKQSNTPAEEKKNKVSETKDKNTTTSLVTTTKGTDKTKEGGNIKSKEKQEETLDKEKPVLNSATKGNKEEGEIASNQNNSTTSQKNNDVLALNASTKNEKENNGDDANLNTPKNLNEGSDDSKNAATSNSVVSTTNKSITPTETSSSTKTVTTTDQLNPEVVGSGSVSPRDKHQFLLSTEVIYSIIDYKVKANANAASQFNQGEPGFVQSYANAMNSNKYKLFNGSASLSYVYKGGFGINAGVGFFNVESTVNTQGFGSKKSVTIIDSLVHAYDSINGWHVIDTTYKQQSSSNYALVNGDTVKNQDYLNNLRFITIPLKLSYNIRLGGKFSVEPQAGIQIAIPVKSYQLIATKAYEFEYKKTKDNLNARNLYFDLGLKLGYKISNSAQLYIKQGYFFRNRSIYPGNYALDYSLKSIYTTFGISIRLK